MPEGLFGTVQETWALKLPNGKTQELCNEFPYNSRETSHPWGPSADVCNPFAVTLCCDKQSVQEARSAQKLCHNSPWLQNWSSRAHCDSGQAESCWGAGTAQRLGKAGGPQRTERLSEHTKERGWGRQGKPWIKVTHLEGSLPKQLSIKLLRINGIWV